MRNSFTILCDEEKCAAAHVSVSRVSIRSDVDGDTIIIGTIKAEDGYEDKPKRRLTLEAWFIHKEGFVLERIKLYEYFLLSDNYSEVFKFSINGLDNDWLLDDEELKEILLTPIWKVDESIEAVRW